MDLAASRLALSRPRAARGYGPDSAKSISAPATERPGRRSDRSDGRPRRRHGEPFALRIVIVLRMTATIYSQPAIVIPRSSAHRSGVGKIQLRNAARDSLASRPRGSFRCAVAAPWTRNFLPSWACLLGG